MEFKFVPLIGTSFCIYNVSRNGKKFQFLGTINCTSKNVVPSSKLKIPLSQTDITRITEEFEKHFQENKK